MGRKQKRQRNSGFPIGLMVLFLALLVSGIVWGEEEPDKAFSTAVKRVHELADSNEVVWPTRRVTDPPGTAMTVLSESAQARDKNTRMRALEGLMETAPDDSIDTFLKALSAPEPEVRALAARALLKCEPKAILDKLLAIVCGADPVALPGVDAALPELKEGFEEDLLTILNSKSEETWRKNGAAYILGRMKSSPAIPLLTQGVWSTDPNTRTTCLNALLAMNDPWVIPHLKKLAPHPQPEVRKAVVQALGNLGGKEAYAVLGEIAAVPPNGDVGVSRKAILLLGATKDKSVVPLLITALERNPTSMHPIINALRQVTNQDFGEEAEEWRAWYLGTQGIRVKEDAPVTDLPILTLPDDESKEGKDKPSQKQSAKVPEAKPSQLAEDDVADKASPEKKMSKQEGKGDSKTEKTEKSKKGMRRFIEKLIPKSHKKELPKKFRQDFIIN